MRKQSAAVLILLAFACLETFLAFDYAVFVKTGNSPANSALGLGQLQTSSSSQNAVQTIFWRNSLPLAASSWTVLCVTFFRQGISRRWRSLGFDRDVFRLMVTMKGARSRLTLLNYLSEPRHKSELSTLTGLDWKEVDRELTVLLRFGLISLHIQSGSVKIYKLSEQGRLLLKLVEEVSGTRTMQVALRSSADADGNT